MTKQTIHTIKIFYCYAHEDNTLREQLTTHLSPLRQIGYITEWFDGDIRAGTDREKECETHLDAANIILLLISSNFFCSDDCYTVAMPRALEKQKAGTACVIPILLRPVEWEVTPIGELSALPTNEKPVTEWANLDKAWLNVVRGITEVIRQLLSKQGILLEDANVPCPKRGPKVVPEWYYISRDHKDFVTQKDFFIGREALLNQLKSMIEKAPTGLSLVISGLGGVGKTQLVMEYIRRHYPKIHRTFLWFNASSPDELFKDFSALAKKLNLIKRDEEDAEIIKSAVKNFLVNYRNWLVIFDNAKNLKQVIDYLPAFLPDSSPGYILFTTRSENFGPISLHLKVNAMDSTEAIQLLLRRAKGCDKDPTQKEVDTDRDLEAAAEIVDALGGIPLAVDQAGAYIREQGCSLTRYLEKYKKVHVKLLEKREELGSGHPDSVYITLKFCFEKQNPDSITFLHLCAFLNPGAISEELVMQYASFLNLHLSSSDANPLQLKDEIIPALKGYSLLNVESDNTTESRTFSLNRLTQDILRYWMAQQMGSLAQKQWAEQVVCAINANMPDVKRENWLECEQEQLWHVQACVDICDKEEWELIRPEFARLLTQIGHYKMLQYRYRRILPVETDNYYERALDINNHLAGEHNTFELASSYHYLGQRYDLLEDKREQALACYKQELEMYEGRVPPNELHVAFLRQRIGELYRLQKQYTEAERYYREAIHQLRSQLGPDHPKVETLIKTFRALFDLPFDHL